MPTRLTRQEAAERLGQSPAFVERMTAKGRLHPDDQGCLAADEVEQLAELLTRLRQSGVATLVGAIGEEL